MSSSYILETSELSKEFKGFVAVNKVNLRVQRGHIHALIGPNGAGKTTCFNLLTKFLQPTSGSIVFDGVDITRVALQRTLGTAFHFWKPESSLHKLDARAMELLAEVDLAAYAQLPAVELSYGRKRALEIATTLAMEPQLMLLDEPTPGMGLDGVHRLGPLTTT